MEYKQQNCRTIYIYILIYVVFLSFYTVELCWFILVGTCILCCVYYIHILCICIYIYIDCYSFRLLAMSDFDLYMYTNENDVYGLFCLHAVVASSSRWPCLAPARRGVACRSAWYSCLYYCAVVAVSPADAVCDVRFSFFYLRAWRSAPLPHFHSVKCDDVHFYGVVKCYMVCFNFTVSVLFAV